MNYENDIINNETDASFVSQDIENSGFYKIEDANFEISDEVKKQSDKFFAFKSKEKKPSKKFENFEIVKTYKPVKKKTDEFTNVVEANNDFETSGETLTLKTQKEKMDVWIRLRTKAKLVLASVCIVIILLGGCLIYNAFHISNLNKDINNISIEDARLKQLVKEIGAITDLSDEEIDDKAVELEMTLVNNNDVYEVELYEKKELNTINEKTSWYDKICNIISSMFGG